MSPQSSPGSGISIHFEGLLDVGTNFENFQTGLQTFGDRLPTLLDLVSTQLSAAP